MYLFQKDIEKQQAIGSLNSWEKLSDKIQNGIDSQVPTFTVSPAALFHPFQRPPNMPLRLISPYTDQNPPSPVQLT